MHPSEPGALPQKGQAPAEDCEPEPGDAAPQPAGGEHAGDEGDEHEHEGDADDEGAEGGDPAPEETRPADAKQGGDGHECVSVGRANAGWLINGVRLASSPRIASRPQTNWGTPETIQGIEAAVEAVHARFGSAPRLIVGDISKEGGGRLRPHRSHQSGRDADIGYFLKKGGQSTYFAPFDLGDLDVPRTWTFIAALLASGDVEYIFIDRAVQAPLRAYAAQHGKLSGGKLDQLFSPTSGRKSAATIIRHARGHRQHMHVRFRAAGSVKAARVWIEKHGARSLKPVAVEYRVKSGDTLTRIARRHKTTVAKLVEWNRISPTKLLRIGQRLVVGFRAPKL
ncbi:MAG: penicillin-insensitive murein endopeptidase [Deltaproteobacteria bacterium]|nr:penicillin-insensitive murein endopeptidase [Deltaproteobacteria bacterium]